eukprot:1724542-Prymnesium_polylepis.1
MLMIHRPRTQSTQNTRLNRHQAAAEGGGTRAEGACALIYKSTKCPATPRRINHYTPTSPCGAYLLHVRTSPLHVSWPDQAAGMSWSSRERAANY